MPDKQQTALQELIEWASTELKLEGYEHYKIINKATSLLPREREQIIQSYVIPGSNIRNREAAEQYFEQHYSL